LYTPDFYYTSNFEDATICLETDRRRVLRLCFD